MFAYLALLWFVMILIFLLLCVPTSDEEDRIIHILAIIGAIICLALLFHTTSDIWELYKSPHTQVSNIPVFTKTEILLDCARYYVPNLRKEWVSIEHCLDEATIYFTTQQTASNFLPSENVPPGIASIAFVHYLDKSSIFVTPIYKELSANQKALVLIHECAHIALDAKDYAYRWQPEFMNLTEQEHYKNADSYFDAVSYHCT